MVSRSTGHRALVAVAILAFACLSTFVERTTQAQSELEEPIDSDCRQIVADDEHGGYAALDPSYRPDTLLLDDEFVQTACGSTPFDERLSFNAVDSLSQSNKLGVLSLRLRFVWRSRMLTSFTEDDTRRFETLANDQWLAWVGLAWTAPIARADR